MLAWEKLGQTKEWFSWHDYGKCNQSVHKRTTDGYLERSSRVVGIRNLVASRTPRTRSPVVLLCGLLFAQGTQTVASGPRATVVRHGSSGYLGRKPRILAARLFQLLQQRLPSGRRLLLTLDDTPTKRFGPQVEGAGIHRNPTPGPARQKYRYGHVWGTLSWLVEHPW